MPESPALPQPAVIVSNAPASSAAADALIERLRADGPVAVLSMDTPRPRAGVTDLRVHPRRPSAPVLRRAVRRLHAGDRLVVLRGADAAQPLRGRAIEARWGALVSRLARLGDARVLPAYATVEGTRLARLWRRWLPRAEGHDGAGSPRVRIGDPLDPRKLASFEGDFEVARYLRLRIGMLGASAPGRGVAPRQTPPTRTPVEPGAEAATLAAEIGALPAAAHLLDAGAFSIYCARAEQIPALLRELGRLREITFRQAGEGTGGAVDLDVYDHYYVHLFIWHRERREIVGGYRLGLADEIMARFGKRGLYSHSLFRFPTRLIERLNPAIELGRSFVRPEHQRGFQPLLLLWRGIAAFVARNPRYRVLFGPVSISAAYGTTSQQLLVDFLTATRSHADLARLVRPRRPFRGQRRPIWRRARFAGLDSIDDVSELIAEVEADAKGVPVLLRQYLKLGGRLLGFNVDDQFSDVLDGLIMVDLLAADRRTLARYFGREGLATFEAYHRSGPADERRSA